jgi:DNA invertase Pin-like site-specific DNA recombinase
MADATRVAVYVRMTRDTQEDSPDRQRGQVYPHCQRSNYEVVEEYFDPGIAGDEFVKRPKFQKLLRDAQAGNFAGIVVDQKDRISRQHPIDYIADVVRPLRQAGVWVEAVATGRLDWSSMPGLLADHITQHQACEEPTKIAYRTLTSLLQKARNGHGVGGPVPYAYVMTYESVMIEQRNNSGEIERRTRKIPLKYALGDPAKVRVVRWLFESYASGRYSLEQLRDELHARAVRGPRGTEWWDKTTIARILSNRRYLGDWIYNRQHYGKWAEAEGGKVIAQAGERRKARKIAEADWVVIPDHHPAIIDRETFAKVQVRLQENRERKTPRVYVNADGTRVKKGTEGAQPIPSPFLLNQLLVCGQCGLLMWGFNERGQRKYRCSGNMRFGASFCGCNTVAEAPVLKTVVAKLEAGLLNPETVERLRADMRRQVEEQESSAVIERLRKRLTVLDKEIKQGNRNLLRLSEDRLPGAEAELRDMEAERKQLAEELQRIETHAAASNLEALIGTAEEILWNIKEAIQGGNPAKIRTVLRDVISKIVLEFKPRTPRNNRSPLLGGAIYLRSEGDAAQSVDSLRVPSHMHHGLTALRKQLEPRLG